ncbi:MAG: hypothetical protein R2851_04510 [Caldilineaceae bacterium]
MAWTLSAAAASAVSRISTSSAVRAASVLAVRWVRCHMSNNAAAMSSTASSVNASNNNVGRSLVGGAGVPPNGCPHRLQYALDAGFSALQLGHRGMRNGPCGA